MYRFIISFSLLKSIFPYFRKHILNILNGSELLFITNFFIFIILLGLLSYKSLFDKSSIIKTVENYKKLSHSHYLCILTIAIFTVASSLLMYEFDKKYNTPLLNSLFIKCFSILTLFATSIFIFKERYNCKQFIGIFLIIIGFILTIQQDPK